MCGSAKRTGPGAHSDKPIRDRGPSPDSAALPLLSLKRYARVRSLKPARTLRSRRPSLYAPDRIRTCDLRFRSYWLYEATLVGPTRQKLARNSSGFCGGSASPLGAQPSLLVLFPAAFRPKKKKSRSRPTSRALRDERGRERRKISRAALWRAKERRVRGPVTREPSSAQGGPSGAVDVPSRCGRSRREASLRTTPAAGPPAPRPPSAAGPVR